MKTKNKSFHWDNFTINLHHPSNLTKALINKTISDFWKKHVENLEDKQHVICLFRVKTIVGTYYTFGPMKKLNKTDKDFYCRLILENLDEKSNDYKTDTIVNILIDFGRFARDGAAPIKNIIKPTSLHQNYRHYKLPSKATMDPLKYGTNLIKFSNSVYGVSLRKETLAKITVKNNQNLVDIIRSGNIVLSYRDKYIDENKFERFIGKNHYIYVKDGADNYKLELFNVLLQSYQHKELNL